MNYQTALGYLFSFINYEKLPFEYKREFNLKRMEFFIERLGRPDLLFPSVLVAGTKGKGSTANFLSSILKANRYKVGLYTSPHLNDPRERIRLNGKIISEREFAKIVAKLKPVIERHRKEISAKGLGGSAAHSGGTSLGPITFFEVFTLVAILYFAQKKADLAIFEIGMGGRLDASNVLNPLISIITPISFDHEEHLGRSLKLIAGEKAAIIKPKGFVISSEQKPEAKKVIIEEARKKKANLFFYGASFQTKRERESLNMSWFDFLIGSKRYSDFKIKLHGRFQIKNAALALAAAAVLENKFGFQFHRSRIKTGLMDAFWPGRFEILKRARQTFVLDGAHNDHSMEELAEALNRYFPGTDKAVILGCSREKNLEAVLRPLIGKTSFLMATRSENSRAQEPKIILEKAREMGYKKPMFYGENLKEAVQRASRLNLKNSVFVITGSLFLVGEARKLFHARN